MAIGARRCVVLGVCLAVLATTSVVGGGASTAASARSAASLKKLKPSMHFTKAKYAPRAKAQLVITLKNTGSTRLRGIGAECDHDGGVGELSNTSRAWGDLAVHGRGVTLAAHSTRTFRVTATVPTAAQRIGHVDAVCDFGYHDVDTGYRPLARASARVPGQSGALDGSVDYFVNGKSGATAGLQNVRLVLLDATRCPILTRKAVTDADGHFRISSAPAGSSYKLYVYPPSGWKVLGGNPTPVLVLGKDTGHLFILAKHGSARVPAQPKKCG